MSKMQNWGNEIVGDDVLTERIYAAKNILNNRKFDQQSLCQVQELLTLLLDLSTEDLNRKEWEVYNSPGFEKERKNYERGILRFCDIADKIRDSLAKFYCNTCDFEGDLNEATIHSTTTGHTCTKLRKPPRRMAVLSEDALDDLLGD